MVEPLVLHRPRLLAPTGLSMAPRKTGCPSPPQPRTREGIALIPFDRCLTLSEESDPCLLVVNRLILTCAL